MTGKWLAHYEILEKLGQGGMGAVYRARDTKLERIVAVKVIGERMAGDPTARARLVREAKTASALNHPNICTIYEVGEAEGQTYIAMEYVEGRPLSVVAAEGMAADTVVRYGAQVADALAHAHEKGIVHRDLKSANVMVTPLGRVKVLDFGLAKRMERGSEATVTQEGTIAGTLAYMAPEVLRGEPAEGPSDVWALGVVLYEAAERRLPFQGKTAFEVTSAILREPMPPLGERVPLGLRVVIQHCLAKEPGARYQRAGEVRAALEAIELMSAPAVAASAPAAVSRRRWLLGGVGTAAVGGAAAAGWLWRRRGGGRPKMSPNQEANEYFQRAMLFLGTQDDLPQGRLMLERALQIDPRFSHARAWYGFTHLLMIDEGRSNDSTWLYKAEEEIRRALREEPNLALGHAHLAAVYTYQGRRELARQEAERALEIDPWDRDALVGLAAIHTLSGDYDQAERLLKRLMDREPLFFPARLNYGEIQRQRGDPKGSIREQEKILEQDKQNLYALTALMLAHLTAGEAAKGRESLERARPEGRSNYHIRLAWALQLAVEGKAQEARRELDAEVLKFAEVALAALLVIPSQVFAVLGDQRQALEWLERQVRVGDERVDWFRRDPFFAKVRDEPRFRQMLESIESRRGKRAAGKQ